MQNNLSKKQALILGALLHDVGKVLYNIYQNRRCLNGNNFFRV